MKRRALPIFHLVLCAFLVACTRPMSSTDTASSFTDNAMKLAAVATAEVITAVSPSYADVSAAIDRAKAGDTVMVPAGKATWSSQLAISKGVNLIGAGAGKTIIEGAYAAPSTLSTYTTNSLIYYNPGVPIGEHVFRLSGFTFNLHNKSGWIHVRHTASGNAAMRNFRIDHNAINGTDGIHPDFRMIYVWGHVFGVIDNNTFNNVGSTLGAYGLNETTWNNMEFEFGTADNLYFEDNTLTNLWGLPHSGGAGGRYCARYNSYNQTENSYFQVFDMHGNQGPGSNLSTMGAEIYGNTIVRSNTGTYGTRLFDHRGGKALIYNNSITAESGTPSCTPREEYIDTSTPPASAAVSGQPQHVSESYYWKNKNNGFDIGTSAYEITGTVDYSVGQIVDGKAYPPAAPYRVVPQWDLDCWRQTPVFDGSSGVGVGLLSERPSSCAREGVAYWVTDTNTLYRWKGRAWEMYYTPYAYPHPRREK